MTVLVATIVISISGRLSFSVDVAEGVFPVTIAASCVSSGADLALKGIFKLCPLTTGAARLRLLSSVSVTKPPAASTASITRLFSSNS